MSDELSPKMYLHPLRTSICDICGKSRGSGKHTACSRKRQRKWAPKWDAYHAQKGEGNGSNSGS